jgi:hypothetical protein
MKTLCEEARTRRFGGKRRSFKFGQRFLLLLRWNGTLDRWYAGVSYHTLRVEGDILKPVGRHSAPLTESGRDNELSVFAAELRALIARTGTR